MIRCKFSVCGSLLSLCILSMVPSAIWAEHSAINLRVIGPKDQQESFADEEPPAGGVNPRPRFTVHAGDPLVLQFILTNVYPHEVIKNVSVRYYVVRTGKLGVKQSPKLTKGVVTQGKATLNLKPKSRVGARLKFRIEEPGIYLVRVETQNTQSDHEHFSAIDLEVK